MGTIIAGTVPSSQITINFAAITAAKPAIAAAERSRPSTVKDIVIASEIKPTIETERKILIIFENFIKLSRNIEKNRIVARITKIVPYL
jgi:hypothetical protein